MSAWREVACHRHSKPDGGCDPLPRRCRDFSSEAGAEAAVERLAVEIASDENETVLARTPGPRPATGGVDEHMDALENHAVGLVFDGKNALHSENVLPLLLHEFREPVVEFFPIAIALRLDAYARDVRVVVMMMVRVGFEEMGIQLGGAVEVEAADLEDSGDVDFGARRAMDRRQRVHLADDSLQSLEFFCGDEIAFVEEDHIGEGDLLLGLVRVLHVPRDVVGIDYRDHAVDEGFFPNVLVHEKGLHNRPGIGEAGRLNEDVVELVTALEKVAEDPDQVSPHGAADAAVVHFKKLLVGADHQLMVDAHLAKFIFDHGDSEAVFFGEDAVEECGFSGS
ncbi:MAG: hypothetical protein RL630_1675 [Verrucomicrobiota bacterium]